jgi:hypothetical protein
MAQVIAFIPDLLFGSTVVGALSAAGHEPVLASDAGALTAALPGSQLLIVDLTYDVDERIALVSDARPEGLKILAFYSHVEADVRDRGLQAGFDLVIPRSRMAREGMTLVDRLLLQGSAADSGAGDSAP